MKKVILLILSGLFIMPLAYSEDWKLLKEGEGVASIYIDQDSYKSMDTLRYFWIKSVMAYPTRRRKRDQKREVQLYHALDCQSKEVYPPIQMKMYRGDGKLLDEINQDFEKIKSGKRNVLEIPAGEKVFDAVCHY